MVIAIFSKHENSTTNIHNLNSHAVFPSKGDILHIPCGSYRPRQRETSNTRKVIQISCYPTLPNDNRQINIFGDFNNFV